VDSIPYFSRNLAVYLLLGDGWMLWHDNFLVDVSEQLKYPPQLMGAWQFFLLLSACIHFTKKEAFSLDPFTFTSKVLPLN
jgi:hypothetical protein